MAKTSACLDSALLERYLRGQIPAVERPPLEDHLAGCPACRASLTALQSAVPRAQPVSDSGTRQFGNGPVERTHSPSPQAGGPEGWAGSRTLAMETPTAGSGSLAPFAPFPFLAPPEQPDELGRFGRYRVLKQLGAGGMGMVFLAEDLDLRRAIALKVMLPEAAGKEGAAQRFLREARVTAAIKNDHIVTIHQVGEDHGVPFLVMELLDGSSLEDRLRKGPQLELRQVIRIGREMAVGLAAAHGRGLIHRDIKPANVWLESPHERVKILDFGLARQVEGGEHLTHSGTILGTPAYMAPEQADGQKVDGRSDLFSLGCVLFRLCTGQAPFQGPTVMFVLKALAIHTPPSVSEIRTDTPPELGQLIRRLLEKDPADRPTSASAVADELAALETSLPHAVPTARRKATAPPPVAAAVPDSPTEPLLPRRKTVAPARRKAVLLGAALAGITCVLAWIGWTVLNRSPRQPEVSKLAPVPVPIVKQPRPRGGDGPLGMKFVHLPKGTFHMGWGDPRKPGPAKTEIKEEFEMAVHTVTQGQWQTVMGNNPSYYSPTFAGAEDGGKVAVKDIAALDLQQFPVETVSWDDTQAFIRKLNEREQKNGYVYRLPMEAEWEYACRGGATSVEDCSWNYYLDRLTNDLSSAQANFDGSLPGGNAAKGIFLQRTAKVGSYPPNRLGLFDMHGNTGQWCGDLKDDQGVPCRVIRGSSNRYQGPGCLTAARLSVAPAAASGRHTVGFRLVRVPAAEASRAP